MFDMVKTGIFDHLLDEGSVKKRRIYVAERRLRCMVGMAPNPMAEGQVIVGHFAFRRGFMPD